MSKNIKEHLKNIAKEIREYKNYRPKENRHEKTLWSIESHIHILKYDYRHNHIAYCELRGRDREQIEKPAQNNLPNEKYIDQIKQEILNDINKE